MKALLISNGYVDIGLKKDFFGKYRFISGIKADS